MRKTLLSLLFVLFSLLLPSLFGQVDANTPPIYSLTEAELTQLESNNAKSLELIAKAKQELNESKSKLAKQSAIMKAQKKELITLKLDLMRQNDILMKTQQSFDAFVQEEQIKQNKLRQQRNIYLTASMILGYFVLRK